MVEILSLGNFMVPKLKKKKIFFSLVSDTQYPSDLTVKNL